MTTHLIWKTVSQGNPQKKHTQAQEQYSRLADWWTADRLAMLQSGHPHFYQASIDALKAALIKCQGNSIMLPPIVTNYISSSSNDKLNRNFTLTT